MKKLVAILLTICMLVTCLSAIVIAKGDSTNSTSTNTTSDDNDSLESSDEKDVNKELDNKDKTDKEENDKSDSKTDTINNSTAVDITEYPEFTPAPVVVDGVRVNVYAPKGVFPEGATLNVTKINSIDKTLSDEAVDKIDGNNKVIADSYTFDISIIDKDGKTKLQPKDASKVQVSFSNDKVSDVNLNTEIYHINEEAIPEDTNKSDNKDDNLIKAKEDENAVVDDSRRIKLTANKLDIVDKSDIKKGTAVVDTDSFSYYTINFTYTTKSYNIYGASKVSVNDISDSVGLVGDVSAAVSSDENAFVVSSEAGKFYVEPKASFTEAKTLTITINQQAYDISVTSTSSAVIDNITTWDDLQTALNNGAEGAVIKLAGDIQANADNNDESLQINKGSAKNIVLDLAGYTLDRACTSSEGSAGHVMEVYKGSLTIIDSSTEKKGTITRGHADNGGAIYIQDKATVIINGGTISSNNAGTDGGAIYCEGTLIMTGGTITGNTAGDTAGAIYAKNEDSRIDISNVSVTSNTAKNKGGAFNLRINKDSSMNNCTINNNKANKDVGGAIHMNAHGKTLTINNCNINGNRSDDDGAAIYIQSGTINMNGGNVNNNISENDSGAVKVTDNTTFTANGTSFISNRAESEEAGAIKNFGDVTLTNCTFKSNYAQKEGGAIWNDKSLNIIGCTFETNSCAKKGGAIYSDDKLSISGNTTNRTKITGNSCKGNGGGIFVGGSSKNVEIGGVIIVKDNNADDGNNIYLRDGRKLETTSEILGNSEIHLTMEEERGIAVKNYGITNPPEGEDIYTSPSRFFISDNGLGVRRGGDNNNDVELYSGWKHVQEMINSAEDGGTVQLYSDCQATSDDGSLIIPGGKNITLDLNGHTLDRNLDSKKEKGHVIDVTSGHLTIDDTSAQKKGTLTGGYAVEGGGIVIAPEGSCVIKAGNITGNKVTESGGGIKNYGTLTITGTSDNNVIISDNYADETGGGIYCSNSGRIVSIRHAKIINNISKEEGGGLNIESTDNTSTEIDYCDISENSTIGGSKDGGGINLFSNGTTLTINNSTINSNVSTGFGAGVNLNKGYLAMNSTRFIGNQSNKGGGAVKVAEGNSLEATNCIFSNNKATGEFGGGIQTDANTTLTSCDITGNQSSKEGGGIFNGGSGLLTMNNCNVTGNLSWSSGGGIYSNKALTINNNSADKKITNNTSHGFGGGLCMGSNNSYDVTIENTAYIFGNTASSGDDVYIDNGNDKTLKLSENFNITSSKIGIDASIQGKKLTSGLAITGETLLLVFTTQNGLNLDLDEGYVVISSGWQALEYAISNTTEGNTLTLERDYTAFDSDSRLEIGRNITINLNGHTINRNRGSKQEEGQVFNIQEGKTLTIEDKDDNSGVITGGYAKKGGAFMIQKGATLNLNGGTIKGNKAYVDGGAIYIKGTLSMTGGVLADNYADDTGGAIYCDSTGAFTMSNAVITKNSSDNYGGAFNIHADSDVSISNSIITENESGDCGGAIRMAATGKTLNISNTTLNNNASVDDGGAIYLHQGKIVMTSGSVSNNTSANDSGAVKVTTKTDFEATNVNFDNNNASGEEAGAIKAWSHVTLTNCTVNENSASKEGGGIDVAYEGGFFSDDYGTLTLNNCEVKNNVSLSEGGGIHVGGGKLFVNGAEITGNKANGLGGGIYADYALDKFEIKGSIIIKDNTSPSEGADCYTGKTMKLTAPITGSEIWITLKKGVGTITKNYDDYHSGVDPATIFKSKEGFDVYEDDGEACLGASWDSLVERINNAESGAIITLDKNYSAPNYEIYKADSTPLIIDGGRTITIDLNGYKINRNRLDADLYNLEYRVFRVIEGSTLNIQDSSADNKGVITGGSSAKGGAIYIDGNSTVNILGGTISYNKANEDGGAIYVNKGTLNITGGIIKSNSSKNGAGIYLNGSDNAVLNMSGGKVINNAASKSAGGIYVDKGSTINMSGKAYVGLNEGKNYNDVYLEGEQIINVVGAFDDDAHIVVDKENGTGQITFGYGANNADKLPEKYFASSKGYSVLLLSGEAVLGYNMSGETDNEYPFIEPGSQINTDVSSLGDTNWMSGISGERYLNEINMPVTHDSSMNNIESKWFDWTTFAPGAFTHKLAKTQVKYINEQMEAGYRKFDLRLNPVYKEYYIVGYWWNDDGKNLYMCHGKTKFGTIQALDPDDDYLKFNTILDWSAEFLRNHPTETIILELSDELDIDYQNEKWEKETYERAGRILKDFSREINPATGESYLYKEEDADSFLEPYTHMPQLKDCRGKVVIMSQSKYLDKTGGMDLNSVGVKSWSGQTYKIGPYEKIDETKEHYSELETSFGKTTDNPLGLRTDVGAPSNYVWSFGLNVTNQESNLEYFWRRINLWDDCAPYEYAETVNPALFGEGNLFSSSGSTDKTGTYLGWVSMDGAKSPYGRDVYMTNFNHDGKFNELSEAYRTVTMEPGNDLQDLGYKVQTNKLLKGTTFTVPGNIFKNLDGKYLNMWAVYTDKGSGFVLDGFMNPGDSITIEYDMKFVPVFLKDGEVPVSIEWHDSNNADGLRDKKINFTATSEDKNPYTFTLSEDSGYRGVIKDGLGANIVPNWDKIPITVLNPGGVDEPEHYRYELDVDNMQGYVFKLYHTSNKNAPITGDINWVDDDNASSTRPNSVTISLYRDGIDDPIATTAVVPDTQGKWSYRFNSQPIFNNGEKINYSIEVNDIDNYATYIDGYSVTNVLKTQVGCVDGLIVWDDSGNEQGIRPDDVTLRLQADNRVVQSQTVKTNDLAVIPFSFENTPHKDVKGNVIDYNVTQNNVDQYLTKVTKADDGTIVVYNKYNDPDKPICVLNTYSSNKECKATIIEPKASPASLSGGYNKETTVTVKAQSKYGYKFLGWYKVNSVDGNQVTSYGELISEDMEYAFKINSDVSMVAVYEPNIDEAMKPTPKTSLVADKTSKELLFHPLMSLPDGYTMKYALGTSNTRPPSDAKFSEEVPKGYDAGTYYVWFKPVGDSYHDDLSAECRVVEIGEGVEPGGKYEDVPVTPGKITDITGSDDAPEESDPHDAKIDNLENLPFDDEDIAMGVNVWVEVSLLDADDVPESEKFKIANASVGYNVASYYDIKVYAKVGLLEPIQIRESLFPIIVSFKSNDKIDVNNTDFGFVRMHDGVAIFLQALYDSSSDRIAVASNLFSTYAFVYKEKNVDPDNPVNPDNGQSTDISMETSTVTAKVKAAKTSDDFKLGHIFVVIAELFSKL